MSTLAMLALAVAVAISWRRLTCEERCILTCAVVTFLMLGAMLSIVLPLVAP